MFWVTRVRLPLLSLKAVSSRARAKCAAFRDLGIGLYRGHRFSCKFRHGRGASPPKPPSKPRRNAPHPTTRKRPRETLWPFGRESRAFVVSGWHCRDRPKANLRKIRGYSSGCQNQKYEAVSEGFVADEPVQGEPVSGEDSLLSGKRTGNFVKIGPFGKKPPVRT
jgi:hypothetical protein